MAALSHVRSTLLDELLLTGAPNDKLSAPSGAKPNNKNKMENSDQTPPARDLWQSKARSVYEKLPNNRAYALDSVGLQSLGALAAAWHERYVAEQTSLGKSTSHSLEMIVRTFAEVALYCPSLIQQRPAAEPSAPIVWTDPITGEPAKNPFAEPQDLTSQSVIEAHDPALAAHLKQVAKGVTYSGLAKQRTEAAGRAKVRDLVYGEAEHKRNPFVRPTTDMLSTNSPRPNMTKIGEFSGANPPEVVEFYRREGTVDVRLPWRKKNLTQLMQIGSHNPPLRLLVTRAEAIESSWIQSDLDELQATERSIASRRKTEELLTR